jgi:acetylornithine deacetylase/succinyl-diaminopimelate desuccinylase-like protein
MADFAAIDRYIDDHLDETFAELGSLCAQPSVSATGEGIAECAQVVADMLRRRGFKVEIMPTAGNPVVYGEVDGTSDKTLLLYNHYDVQPPEPYELWTSPPFEMTKRDGKLYARGVSDDKGHIVCRLAALDAIKAVTGLYPCRIKFVIEGEEEVGSNNLAPFIINNAEKLKADACVWEFGQVDYNGRPIQHLGLRGIVTVELGVQTATLDAHSGLGGSILPNAAWRLVWALSTIKDVNENILIPGFYDDVVPPTKRDLELLTALPDDTQAMLDLYGAKGYIKGLKGGVDWRVAETFVPTANIEGLTSGYQGVGSKTIMPAQASAKLDFRIVPNQDPDDLIRKLRKHLDDQGFSDVVFNYAHGSRAGRTDPDDPFVQLTLDTAREVYGKEPVVMPMIGGSGPNAVFIDALNVPIVMAGVGSPHNRVHAPDENVDIENFKLGIRHSARIAAKFGGV